MSIFSKYPYQNYSDFNLDWIIQKIKETMDEQEAQREYLDMLKAWIDTNEPRIDEIEAAYDLIMSGVLPESMITALNNWISQYGVLAQANAYTDEKVNPVRAALTDEISDRSAEDTRLQSEIDQLIAPTGTAPNAAEIENARIGQDGVTYSTLGTAIRTQFTNLINKSVLAIGSANGFTDFNDALPNRIYTITSSGIANVPDVNDYAGTLLTYRYAYSINYKTGTVQLFLSNRNNLYTRINWGGGGGSWGAWTHLTNSADANNMLTGVSTVNALSDFNAAEQNKIYLFTSGTVANCPTANAAGTLMTFRYLYSTNYSVGTVQIFVTETAAAYIRIKWGPNDGTWTDWKNLSTNYEPVEYATLAVFEKIGVVGDSFAAGEIVIAPGTNTDYYNLSWGSILARKCGITAEIFAAGGLSTRTWLTNARGLAMLNSSPAQNLYILALGINDNALGADYIGSLSDVTSHSQPADYGDTFYGNYGRIVEAIKAKAPNAKIIFSKTAFNYDNFPAINTAIEELASYYGVALVDPRTDPFMGSSRFNTRMMNGHPTAVMYSGMAEAYDRMFSEISDTYYDYFKNYVG